MKHLSLCVLLVACGGTDETTPEPVPVASSQGGEVDEDETDNEAHEPRGATGPMWDPDRDPLGTPVDVAAPPAYAEQTSSGLASYVLRAGTGTTHPTETTAVTVHYAGWTTDGRLFDSSHQRGRPATFPLNRVIVGWTEGVQLMVEGEIRRFWIPVDMAYGNRPQRPMGMLIFDIELISF